jgi:hypothetical protein
LDHKEQHHLKHVREREHEKKQHQEHDRELQKRQLPFHPAWLFVLGAVLAILAMLVWMF